MTGDGSAKGYVHGTREFFHLCWLWDGCLEVKALWGYHLCQWQEAARALGNISV